MCIGGCPKCECVKTDEEREYFVVVMVNKFIMATSEEDAIRKMKKNLNQGYEKFEITAELQDIIA